MAAVVTRAVLLTGLATLVFSLIGVATYLWLGPSVGQMTAVAMTLSGFALIGWWALDRKR